MSTRAITVLKDGKDILCKIYTHGDGYPSYHGRKLKEFLNSLQGRDSRAPLYFEDVSHLGMLLIAHLAASRDFHRLYPIGYEPEEYNYIVMADYGKDICLRLERDDGKAMYEGPVSDFEPDAWEDND